MYVEQQNGEFPTVISIIFSFLDYKKYKPSNNKSENNEKALIKLLHATVL